MLLLAALIPVGWDAQRDVFGEGLEPLPAFIQRPRRVAVFGGGAFDLLASVY